MRICEFRRSVPLLNLCLLVVVVSACGGSDSSSPTAPSSITYPSVAGTYTGSVSWYIDGSFTEYLYANSALSNLVHR